MHRKVSVVSDYLMKVTSNGQILMHRAIHLDYGTTVEYTFCVNFEPQRCTISVYTAAVDFAMACLSEPRSQTACCLRLVFAAPRGGLK